MTRVYFLWLDYWTLKEWKTSKVHNHSILAYSFYTNNRNGALFDILTATVSIYFCHIYFFSATFLNMCKPKTPFCLLWGAGPPGLAFSTSTQSNFTSFSLSSFIKKICWGGCAILWKWASILLKLAGDVEHRLARFHEIRIFLQMKFIIFQGCLIKLVTFLTGQPAQYNQLLIESISLVLVICLSWYLLLHSRFNLEFSLNLKNIAYF